MTESCLLHWIQSSQQSPFRADKAFKCPQCGATYEIESYNPLPLRILDFLNKRLTMAVKMVTIAGIGTTLATFGTCESSSQVYNLINQMPMMPLGIYLLCTSYGAWAVREFLGKEM